MEELAVYRIKIGMFAALTYKTPKYCRKHRNSRSKINKSFRPDVFDKTRRERILSCCLKYLLFAIFCSVVGRMSEVFNVAFKVYRHPSNYNEDLIVTVHKLDGSIGTYIKNDEHFNREKVHLLYFEVKYFGHAHQGIWDELFLWKDALLTRDVWALVTILQKNDYLRILWTFSFLLGNKGAHCYNGNPRKDPGEASLTQKIITLIKKDVDESVGFIRILDKQFWCEGTGFRVGRTSMMTAYHVFDEKISKVLQTLAFPLQNINSEEQFRDLITRLEMDMEKDNTESYEMAVSRVINKFIERTATNIPLLLHRLRGIAKMENVISDLTKIWKQDCVVTFINHGAYTVDWRVEFGNKEHDILIMKLLETQTGQQFPKPMLLDEHCRQLDDIHVIRYIHENSPKIVMDQGTVVFKSNADAQKNVEQAVEWWKDRYPDTEQRFFRNEYAVCCKAVDEETGRVILRASKSFTPGSSGSPVVCRFDENEHPFIGMIYQRGYPEFYYNALVSKNPEISKYKDVQIESKCLFEGATTMKKVAELLETFRKSDLKEDIFSAAVKETRNVNIGDLKLLEDTLNKSLDTLKAEQEEKADLLNRDVEVMKADISAVTNTMNVFEKDVNEVKEDLISIKEDVMAGKQDVDATRDNLQATLREGIDTAKQNAATMSNDLRRNTDEKLRFMQTQMVTREEIVNLLPRNTTESGQSVQDTPANRENGKPPDDMVMYIENWKEMDRFCFVTKSIEETMKKIASDEHGYLSVTGVPGSGKSTTIRHAALFMMENFGYTIFPIFDLQEFFKYLEKDKKQLFIIDDPIGEYSVDMVAIKQWDKYNDKIKSCLQRNKNTKVLTAIRSQLFEDIIVKGERYIFNDKRHNVNLSDASYKLDIDDMKNMLTHYLKNKQIDKYEYLVEQIPWVGAEKFANCFPLLCKVFSEEKSVRKNPKKFFNDPFPALTSVFRKISIHHVHQFCGLVLVSVFHGNLKDEVLSILSQENGELEEGTVRLRDVIMESLELDLKDLRRVKFSLEALDGVYVSHVGSAFRITHTIFQNIVTFLYNDASFVFQYGTTEFLRDRVRINEALSNDDKYVLVFSGDDNIERLVNRLVRDLISDKKAAARFIATYRYIDEDWLLSSLKLKLFNNKDVSTKMIETLFHESMWVVYSQRSSFFEDINGEMTGPCCKLAVMLIMEGVNCNMNIGTIYPLHIFIEIGSLKLASLVLKKGANIKNVTKNRRASALHWIFEAKKDRLNLAKLCIENGADVNLLDKDGKSVLHMAVKCGDNIELTSYFLSLPNLTCLSQADNKNKTAYAYVNKKKKVPRRQEMKDLYKQNGAS